MNHSTRRLSWARDLIGAERYLEIGVFKGDTFNTFECAHKDAVDPKFLFDASQYATDTVRFFEQTSDSFFLEPEHEGEPPYDLAFIDGLHTYEQTLRDLMNVLVRSHDRSVILIDDTHPNDIYSAETDFERTLFHRKRADVKSMAWHGDVFKLVFFIHDFLPTLSFATIMRSGNPQTIVWRQRRVGFTPIFNDTEKISRMTYFDMWDHRKKMNLMQEQAARELMAAALGNPKA